MPKSGSIIFFYYKNVSVDFTDKAIKDFDFLFFESLRQFYGLMDQDFFYECIPNNIHVAFIPPSTPEMNPIEQIWKEIRKMGFRNEVFDSLAAVVDRLCSTIVNLSAKTIQHITARKWIVSCFN